MDQNKNYKFAEETQNYNGKYFSVTTKKYKLETDSTKEITWECLYRNNMADFKKINGAEIIGILKDREVSNMNELKVVLIENYRYPVEKKVLEFPAGLIDNEEYAELENIHNEINKNEIDLDNKKLLEIEYENKLKMIIIKAAERELKEETGYHGQFKSFFTLPKANPIKIFEKVFYDPWKSLENGAICIFEIDNTHELNIEPRQDLEDCEQIKVHLVKLGELLNFISDKIENENYGCSQHVYSFAMGLQFNSILSNLNII